MRIQWEAKDVKSGRKVNMAGVELLIVKHGPTGTYTTASIIGGILGDNESAQALSDRLTLGGCIPEELADKWDALK